MNLLLSICISFYHPYLGKSRLQVLEHVIQLYKIDLCESESTQSSEIQSSSSSASKSLVSSLLQKHIQMDQTISTLSEELYRFQNVTFTDDNILYFWKKKCIQFPKISRYC